MKSLLELLDQTLYKEYVKRTRCCVCGKFMKTTEFTKINYTPDSEFTVEKFEYTCQSCQKKEQKDES